MNLPVLSHIVESPRYACSLGGGIATASAIHRVIPIIHAGPGCGMQLFNGLQYVSGYQGATYVGSSAIPATNTTEREVVFGGEPKLQETIESTVELMDADLYFVLTGCTSEIIGDDVQGIVADFRRRGVNIAHASTSGFKGLTRRGYEQVLESLIDTLVQPLPRDPKLVNLFGIVPSADPFWQGNLQELAQLLGDLGLKVNTFFANRQGIEAIRSSSAAALNIVLSPELCADIVKVYQERFSIPHVRFDGVPVGPTMTGEFIREVGRRLELGQAGIDALIQRGEQGTYDYFERAALAFTGFGYQHRIAVLGDASSVVSITRFLTEDFGQIPVAAVVIDPTSEAGRDRVLKALSNLGGVATPEVVFTDDQQAAWAAVSAAAPTFILGSSLDKDVAQDLGALHLSVSFPIADRVLLSRNYAGYRGAVTLAEDFFAPALTTL